MDNQIVVVGIDLEKDGSLIEKRYDQNLTIRFDWDHVGATITFDAWVAIGHQSLTVDSFGKSFAVDGAEIKITGLSCPADATKKGYYHSLTRALNLHYGSGETIGDGAIRVVLKIPGQADKAGYLWNAFKITKVAAGFTLTVASSPSGTGSVKKEPDKASYSSGEIVKLTATPASGYKFSYWDCDGESMGTTNPINFMVLASHKVTAHFV